MTRVACLLVGVARDRRRRARGRRRPTFTKDVAPIVFNNCATCHRAGEVAPMTLTSYEDVRPWAKVIKNKVVSREMPPWGADPAHSLKMRNDRSLTQAQIDTIVAWVDGGAPKGSDADLPPMPKFAEGWTFGREPDAILEMPVDFAIPAEGELGVQMFYSKVPWTEDRFAETLEIRPGNRAVVHHAGVFVVDIPEGATIVERPAGDAGRQGVDRSRRRRSRGAPTTPRCRARTSCCRGCPAAASIRTAPTSASAFRPASTSTGRSTTTRSASATTDRTRLGIWFNKAPVTHEAADPPGGRSRWRRPRAACRCIAPKARKSSTPPTRAARAAAARRRTFRPTPRTGR